MFCVSLVGCSLDGACAGGSAWGSGGLAGGVQLLLGIAVEGHLEVVGQEFGQVVEGPLEVCSRERDGFFRAVFCFGQAEHHCFLEGWMNDFISLGSYIYLISTSSHFFNSTFSHITPRLIPLGTNSTGALKNW